jgi:hypothetical protein
MPKLTPPLSDATSGCVTDYIDIKTENTKKIATISFLNLAANPPKNGWKCDKKLQDVLHTCLHAKMTDDDKKAASCNAAKAQCTPPIAGGAQEMENWAKNNCKGNKADCTKQLQEALASDGFWGAVTDWFKKTTLGIDSFAYATGNANQEQYKDPAALKAVPTALCHDFETADFDWSEAGLKKSGKCVKAIWASMYLTSFFGGTTHPETQAHMGPDTDWSEGYPLTLLDVDDRVDVVDYHYTDGFFQKL